jgi:hypothetical protein
MVRACLPFGDYAVEGLESRACVERKAELDLVSSLFPDWERFSSRLAELATLELCAIVAETSGERLVARAYVPGPLPMGRIDPKRERWLKLLERIKPAEVFSRMAMIFATYRIPVFLAGHSPTRASTFAFNILTMWHDREKAKRP